MSTDTLSTETARPMLDEEGVWRCTLCGWEIETDDGLQGYCNQGHLFDCTNIPEFCAVDEEDTDNGSVISSEEWDEYEEDGLLDDDEIEDPHKTLVRLIKDMDNPRYERPYARTMLLNTLDKIASEAEVYETLIQAINSTAEGDAEEAYVAHEQESTKLETKTNTDEESMSTDSQSQSDADETVTSDEEDIVSEGEESASMWEENASEEDETTSEEEEEFANKVDDVVQPDTENVRKLKETIAFLTKLCSDASLTTASPYAEARTHSSQGASNAFALNMNSAKGRLLQRKDSPAWQRLMVEAEEDDQARQPPLLFDPEKIKAVIKRRKDLVQESKANPEPTSDDESNYSLDLVDVDDDLVDAIWEARLARNEAKEDEDAQAAREAHY